MGEQLQQQNNSTDNPGDTQDVKDSLKVPHGERQSGALASTATPLLCVHIFLDPLRKLHLKIMKINF